MKKIDLLKEWYQQNLNFLEELKHRSHIHKNLENAGTIPSSVFEESEPVFALSTGRVGTMMLTKLMETCSDVEVYHEALPDMLYAGKFAYDHPSQLEWIKGAAIGGRYELVRNSFIRGKRFIETNNRLTFLALGLAEVFPKAKFVHVIRHPDSFVASGIQRGWYTGSTITEEGRITPREVDSEGWTQADKIAWLWNATNQFCEEVKQKLGEDKVRTIRSEDLFNNATTAVELMQWIGLKGVNEQNIAQLLEKPVNQSKQKKAKPVYNTELTPLRPVYYPD